MSMTSAARRVVPPAMFSLLTHIASQLHWLRLVRMNESIEEDYGAIAFFVSLVGIIASTSKFLEEPVNRAYWKLLGAGVLLIACLVPHLLDRYHLRAGLSAELFATIAVVFYLLASLMFGVLLGGLWAILVRIYEMSKPTRTATSKGSR